MNDKEKRVKEIRLADATRNNFVGMEGKFGVILKYLGHPIISHYQTNTIFDNGYGHTEEINENEIPEAEECGMEMIGFVFDGLSNGSQLEILYFDNEQKITVKYKGYNVYVENSGDLECYVPMKEWENEIERFYKIALSRQNKERKKETEVEKQQIKREKFDLLNKLKRLWGD